MKKLINHHLVLLTLALIPLLVHALHGVASDFQTYPNVSPEALIFPNGLNSNIFNVSGFAGWQTFASSKAVHVVNMIDRTYVYRDTLFFTEDFINNYFNEKSGLWLLASNSYLVEYNIKLRNYTYVLDFSNSNPGFGNFLGFIKVDEGTVLVHYENTGFTYNFQTKERKNILNEICGNRPAVIYNSENLIYYQSNYDDAFFLNLKTNVKTPVKLPYKMNFLQNVPGSNFIFAQTSDATRAYYMIDVSAQSFQVVQKVTTSLVTAAARIYTTPNAIIIAENLAVEKHSLTSKGNTEINPQKGTLLQPVRNAFFAENDYRLIYFTNALQVQNYDLNTLLPNENFVPSSSGVLPHIVKSDYFLIKGTEDTYTFRTIKKIVIKKGSQTVREFAPSQARMSISSGIYLKDKNAWILGYNGFVLHVSLSDGNVTRIDSPLFEGKKVINPIYLDQYGVVAVFMNTESIVFIDVNTLKIKETQKASSASDRVPLQIDGLCLLFYSANSLFAQVIEPGKAPRQWEHKLAPGINYIVNIPDSNYCIVQTNDAPKKLYIYNKIGWIQVQEIKESALNSPKVYVRRNSRAKFYVAQNGQTEVFSISDNFKASLVIRKIERKFEDITVSELKSDEYFVHYSNEPDFTNNYAVFSGSTDVMSSSLVESFYSPPFAVGPISSVDNFLPQSNFRTYISKNSILIEDNERGVIMKEVQIIKENIQSFVYIPERTLWILGYNKKILFVNILTWQVQTYTNKYLESDVKGLYLIPNTDSLAIYQPLKPIYLLKFDTKNQPIYTITPSFLVDLPPLQNNDNLLVFSSNSVYGELFKLSDITNLQPINKWEHGISGIAQGLRIPETNYLVLRDNQTNISIYSGFNLRKVSDVVKGNVKEGSLVLVPGSPLFVLKNGAQETVWDVDEMGRAVNKLELVNRPIYNRVLKRSWATLLIDDIAENINIALDIKTDVLGSYPFMLVDNSSLVPLRNTDTIVHLQYKRNVFVFFNGLNMAPMHKQLWMTFDGDTLDYSEIIKSNCLLVRTTSATYVVDWFTGDIVAKLEASIIALGIKNIIFYQSAATNNLIHYDYVSKSVVLTTPQTYKALNGKAVYHDDFENPASLDRFFLILNGASGKNTVVLANLAKIESVVDYNLYFTDSSCKRITVYYTFDKGLTGELRLQFCSGSKISQILYDVNYKTIAEFKTFLTGTAEKDIKNFQYFSDQWLAISYDQGATNDRVRVDFYKDGNDKIQSTSYLIPTQYASVIKGVYPGSPVLLYKIGGSLEFYNILKQTCDSGQEMIVPNPAVNYCDKACPSGTNRVFLEGDNCWSQCPVNFNSDKFDFSDRLTGSLCSSTYCKWDCFQPETYSSNLIILTFDSYLNSSQFNDSLCLVPPVIGVSELNLVRLDTNKGCEKIPSLNRLLSQSPPRILGSSNSSNQTQYLLKLLPHLTSFTGDISKTWVERNRDDIIVKYNQAKAANSPALRNLSFVTDDMRPKQTEVLNWTTLEKNVSLIENEKYIQVALRFENVASPALAYFGYYVDVIANPRKLDNPLKLKAGVDNNDTALDWLTSLTTDSNGVLNITLPMIESGDRIKFLWTLETFSEENKLLGKVEYYNYRIKRSFSSLLNACFSLIIFVILAFLI